MSTIKKFDEFVNEMLLKENRANYGKTNILSDLIYEFIKKYYNTDYRKFNRSQQYVDFFEKHPELEEFIEYLEEHGDDFTIGIYFYASEDDRGNVDYDVDDLDDDDYERCEKIIKSYTDKNMSKKMLDIIEDVIYNNVDISDAIEDAGDRYDAWEDEGRDIYYASITGN